MIVHAGARLTHGRFDLPQIFLLSKRRLRNDSMAAAEPILRSRSVRAPAELKESD
jgi:hypothetical protein